MKNGYIFFVDRQDRTVFVTEKETFETTGRMSSDISDDIMEQLENLECNEMMECVYEYHGDLNPTGLHEVLEEVGFEYSESFQRSMNR